MQIWMKPLLLILVLGPLFAAISSYSLSGLVKRRQVALINIGFMLLSFIIASYLFIGFVNQTIMPSEVHLYNWGHSAYLNLKVGFYLDGLSVALTWLVTAVSLVVQLYSSAYMHQDRSFARFFAYLSLFSFMMLILVLANNVVQLFLGWEGVGLVSYLLIGFWYQKPSAIQANLKAFLINRFSDMGFLLAIGGLALCFKSMAFSDIFAQLSTQAPVLTVSIFGQTINVLTIVAGLLLLAAMGKSAQMPLHVWLPDSMEGPTPISALIHAATMVTAGIYLIARFSPLFELCPNVLNLMLGIGACTALLMGILGVVQNDIKRIIAYSTLSQLGIMVCALGASEYHLAIFHLLTHGFFKALLFLGAGAVIYSLHHEQNIWQMGGLKKDLPVAYYTMLLGSLSLCGMPFFSGFYSKDLIIEALLESHLPLGKFAYYAALASVYFTSLYSFRLLIVVFLRPATVIHHSVPSTPTWIKWPLIILGLPSVMFGAWFMPHLGPLLQNSTVVMRTAIESSWLTLGSHGFRSYPFALVLAGFSTATVAYIIHPDMPKNLSKTWPRIYQILIEKYGFDRLYLQILAPFSRYLGLAFFRRFDIGIVDKLVNQFGISIKSWTLMGRQIQTGYLYHYAFAMILGLMGLVLMLILHPFA